MCLGVRSSSVTKRAVRFTTDVGMNRKHLPLFCKGGVYMQRVRSFCKGGVESQRGGVKTQRWGTIAKKN